MGGTLQDDAWKQPPILCPASCSMNVLNGRGHVLFMTGVTGWPHSNTTNRRGFALMQPLLLFCGPFLSSSTSRRSGSCAQRQTDQSGLVWIRSGAHSWGLCTVQLQHKWIFTWLCYVCSFLTNRVSARVKLWCGCGMCSLVFYAPPSASCAHSCPIFSVFGLQHAVFVITCSLQSNYLVIIKMQIR